MEHKPFNYSYSYTDDDGNQVTDAGVVTAEDADQAKQTITKMVSIDRGDAKLVPPKKLKVTIKE